MAPIARSDGRGKRGLVTWLALAAVALTIASSGIVFSEPAPVDALSIGLIVLLPTIGLVAFNRGAAGIRCAVARCRRLRCARRNALARSAGDDDPRRRHALSLCRLFRVGGVRRQIAARPHRADPQGVDGRRPDRRRRCGHRLLRSLCPAARAVHASTTAPAARSRIRTCSARSSSCPSIYMLSVALESRLRGMILPLAIAAFLTLAVFLSFSRGAWINLVVSPGDLSAIWRSPRRASRSCA